MDSDPDATVYDLRAGLFELLDELKEIKYSCVDDVARFLETTRDDEARALIPKLRKKKVWMQLLRIRLIKKVQDQLFCSVTHGVSSFTRRHIAGASTVGPSTVTWVSLRSIDITSKKDLPERCKSSHFSL